MPKKPSPPAAEVTRLVCASVSQVKGSVMDELFAIRERVACSPKPTTVRAALLHASGWFVLWLEGPAADVEAVRARGAADPRNAHQKVIHRSVGPATLIETFSLATIQLPESPSAFARRVLRAKAVGQEAGEPQAVWQYLCSPCTAAGAGSDAPAPIEHVALLAADDNGPIDLLRSIGARHGAVVAYQRFANSHRRSADVGIAYVDVPMGERIKRILLISRRALGYELVCKSLAGLDAMVLLLGDRPAAAIELARGVSNCLAALRARPTVHLVSSTQEQASPVSDLLEGARTTWLAGDRVANFLEMQPC